MSDLVLVSIDGSIATVELNRKSKRNALNMALRDALEGALTRLEEDRNVKAVILHGGPQFFCAGFDLQEMAETKMQSLMHRALEFQERTLFFKKPLVTAISGFALAGGFDLATAGDVIVAAEGSLFGRPEVQWGPNPLLVKVVGRIGVARATQISLSGEKFPAKRAKELGIVDRIVPPDQLLAAAREEAERISGPPLETLMAIKRAAMAVPFLEPRLAVDFEFGLTASLAVRGAMGAQLEAYTDKTLK